MGAQMFLFVCLTVVFSAVYAIENEVEMLIQKKFEILQKLDALSVESFFVKIAGIQGMICIIND